MTWAIDARVPVTVLPEGAPFPDGKPAAWLGEVTPEGAVTQAMPGAAHPVACACCGGRSPVGEALGVLFQARARGDVPWFDRVLVSPALEAELRAALREDILAAARFRLVEPA